MVKFDYSLDVGESIKTDEVLKEKEKEAPNCGCGAPKQAVKLSDEDKITDQKEEIKEEEQETVEEEQLENVPETEKKTEPKKKEEKEEKVEIKPVSFEKAKLVSDYTEEPKKAEEEPKKAEEEPKKAEEEHKKAEEEPKKAEEEPKTAPEKPTPEEDTEEEEIEKPEEEDEKDVNEFLDDSFNKEAKKYEQFNNNKTKTTVEEPVKKSIWPIIILIILIGAAALGYGYAVFKEPADIAEVPEIVNTVQPVEPIIELQNITENNTLPEQKVIEEPENKTEDNKTIDQALDLFTAGLKDN